MAGLFSEQVMVAGLLDQPSLVALRVFVVESPIQLEGGAPKVSRFSVCQATGGKHVPGKEYYCEKCGAKIAF